MFPPSPVAAAAARRFARALAVVLLAASAALPAWPGRAAAQPPDPNPDPTRDLPLPLPRGAILAAQDVDKRLSALAARLASARPGSDEAARAALGLGVLKVAARQYGAAVSLLAPRAQAEDALSGWAWLYLGLARRALGDHAPALEAFQRAADGPADLSPAQDAALLRLYSLEALGRNAQALEGYRQMLSRPGLPLRPLHLWRAGQLAAATGDAALARALLRELVETYPWTVSADKALPLARELASASGGDWSPDAPTSLANRARLLLDRSLPGKALPLVERLAQTPGADPALTLYLRGRIAYLRRDSQEAAGLFDAVARQYPGSPLAPWALYQQARCLWRSGRAEDALVMDDLLQTAAARAEKDTELAALAWRHLMLANLERARFDQAAQAAARLARLSQARPEFTEQAAWLLGLIALATGDVETAETRLGAWTQNAKGENRSAGLYWLARTAAVKGDAERAARLYLQAFSAWPGGYYAAQAEQRLAALGMTAPWPPPLPGCPGTRGAGAEAGGPAARSETEASAGAEGASQSADQPLSASDLFAGGKDDAADATPEGTAQDAAPAPRQEPLPTGDDVRAGLDRAGRLEACGLPELAERDMAALAALHPVDRALALAYARLAAAQGNPQGAARAVSRAFAGCLAHASPQDLAPLRDILYPRRHADLLAQHLAGSGEDPALLCGLIRQESFFDPAAVSPAGAVGLMQVMPSTAKTLAARMGIKDFRPETLKDPAVNIRYGVRFFLDRAAQFGGNTAFTLAAYNAGQVKLKVWSDNLGGLEPDLFTEFIPYAETRDYVKRILANRAMYHRLYPAGG